MALAPRSQLGLMKYHLIVVIHHIFWHTGTCLSVFVFGCTIGTWPPAITVAERREREKPKRLRLCFYLKEYLHFHVYEYINLDYTILTLFKSYIENVSIFSKESEIIEK